MRKIGAYEAKTHLPRLLDEVAAGAAFTITKHDRAVALLVPPGTGAGMALAEAADGIRAFRANHRLGILSIRDLIDEGRA